MGIIDRPTLIVDKSAKYGKMILDIVDRTMKNTRSRVPTASSTTGRRTGIGLFVLLVLLLAVVGCRGDDGGVSAATRDPSSIVVSTVESKGERSTAVPTTTPPAPTPTPTPPAPLAARVNGEYVFLADYEQQVSQYEQALQDLGVDLGGEEAQAELAQGRLDILEGLIDDVLIGQGAADLGVTVRDDELAARVASDIESGGGQAAFAEWLDETGLGREDYEETLRQSMLVQRVWDVVTSEVPAEADQVHARHIVVESAEAAQQIVSQLHEGADFVALAREQSLDLATRDNGGDLGWFPRGVMVPALEDAAFALQPGEIGGGVEIAGHYHVIQVVEREAARPLAPEMLMQLKQDRFDEWLGKLRAVAVIERYVGE